MYVYVYVYVYVCVCERDVCVAQLRGGRELEEGSLAGVRVYIYVNTYIYIYI